MLCFPIKDNPIETVHPKSDVSWLREQHFKSKEKLSTVVLVGFKILKEYAKKRRAVEKSPSRQMQYNYSRISRK